MESRKITVVSTDTNSKIVFNSEATTLGELKNDLDSANMNYEGMVFYEGLSRTELIDDDSQLPKDVTRTNRETGEVETTNELLFLLSPSAKKYNSGVSGHNDHRSNLFTLIRMYNLQAACMKKYGKNFTNCTTGQLEELVEKFRSKAEAPKAPAKEKLEECKAKKMEVKKGIPIEGLIVCLIEKGILTISDIEFLKDLEGSEAFLRVVDCSKDKEKGDSSESPYSDEEIQDVINSLR